MPIDTAAKRAAALRAGHPAGIVLPIPDGTIDATDRGQLAGVYLPGQAAAPARVVIPVNGGQIAIKTPAETLHLRFDWNEALPDGVTLTSVAHTVPGGAVEESEDTNGDGTSDLDISGGAHGALYQLTIVATLSDASTVTRSWPLRIFNA